MTRQVVQAVNPDAALEAWVIKIGSAGKSKPSRPCQILTANCSSATGRAGARTSEDRSALWGYSLNSVKPEGTRTLTHDQAQILLSTFSGMDNCEAEQMLAEAHKAFGSEGRA